MSTKATPITIESRNAMLREAQALIASKGWCQREYARDKEGMSIEPYDERAVAYCATGAIAAAVGVCKPALRGLCENALLWQINQDAHEPACVALWNDQSTRTKEQVLELFTAAQRAPLVQA